MQQIFVKSFYPKFINQSNDLLTFYDTNAFITRVLPESQSLTGSFFDMIKHLSIETATEISVKQSVISEYVEGKNVISVFGMIKIKGTEYFFNHHIIAQIAPSIKIFSDVFNVIDYPGFVKIDSVFTYSKPAAAAKPQERAPQKPESKEEQKKKDSRNYRQNRPQKSYDNQRKGKKPDFSEYHPE